MTTTFVTTTTTSSSSVLPTCSSPTVMTSLPPTNCIRGYKGNNKFGRNTYTNSNKELHPRPHQLGSLCVIHPIIHRDILSAKVSDEGRTIIDPYNKSRNCGYIDRSSPLSSKLFVKSFDSNSDNTGSTDGTIYSTKTEAKETIEAALTFHVLTPKPPSTWTSPESNSMRSNCNIRNNRLMAEDEQKFGDSCDDGYDQNNSRTKTLSARRNDIIDNNYNHSLNFYHHRSSVGQPAHRRCIFSEACKKQERTLEDTANLQPRAQVDSPSSDSLTATTTQTWSTISNPSSTPVSKTEEETTALRLSLNQQLKMKNDHQYDRSSGTSMGRNRNNRSFRRSESLPCSTMGRSMSIDSVMWTPGKADTHDSFSTSLFFNNWSNSTDINKSNVNYSTFTKSCGWGSSSSSIDTSFLTTSTSSSNSTGVTNAVLPVDCRLYGVSHQEIHEFVQPEHSTYQREHLKRLEELPSISCALLPTLPSPLSRLRKHSGVYPLNSPQSILRKKTRTKTNDRSCNHTLPSTVSDTFEQDVVTPPTTQPYAVERDDKTTSMAEQEALIPSVIMSASYSFRSPSSKGSRMCSTSSKTSHPCSSGATTGNSISTTSNIARDRHSGGNAVHFDPRVTVTELFDQVQRQWYSDEELEGFKYTTLLLVKQYLLQHPEALLEYNSTVIDPITGLKRRKAMFSLPILGCNSVECHTGNQNVNDATNNYKSIKKASSNQFNNYRNEMKRLAKVEVQRILIVDPNQLILDLFQRSLQTIFPNAKVDTSKSGEEAFRRILVQSGYNKDNNDIETGAASDTVSSGYDIVIVEERLFAPPERSPAIGMNSRKGDYQQQAAVSTPATSVATASTLLSSHHVRLHSYSGVGGGTSTTLSPKLTQQLQQNPNKQQPMIHDWNTKSGSQLIKQIQKINEITASVSAVVSTTCSNITTGSNSPTNNHKCSLLIGVTSDPCNETKLFLQSGADVVWGKPPPCMNELLRNQLVTLIAEKRKKFMSTKMNAKTTTEGNTNGSNMKK